MNEIEVWFGLVVRMKKKPYHQSSPLVTGTLTRSRTYIVVPRDVPPENFLTVTETRKVTRTDNSLLKLW